MSTYIVGYIRDGYHPQFTTQVNDERVLDDYCDLQQSLEDDGVFYYEEAKPDQGSDLPFIGGLSLLDYVDSLACQVQKAAPTAYDYLID